MTIDQLREARERRPFRPFEIRMTDGETVTILRPENIAWDEELRVVTCLAGGAFVLIDVDLIMSVRTPLTGRSKEAGKS